MPEGSARDLAERYTNALNHRDWKTLEATVHADYYVDFPQSGERIRGFANLRAMFEGYPGGLSTTAHAGATTVIGGEDRWVVTPNFTVVRVTGTSDVFTIVARAAYPDGSEWFVISTTRAEEGRMRSATTYFAPAFEAPEWRASIVEPIPGWTPLAAPPR